MIINQGNSQENIRKMGIPNPSPDGLLSPTFLNPANQAAYAEESPYSYEDYFEMGSYDPDNGLPFLDLKSFLADKIVKSRERVSEAPGIRSFSHLAGFQGRSYNPDEIRSQRTNVSSDPYASSFVPGDFTNIPNIIKSLGTKTVDFGGSTKFEKFHPALDIANVKGTPIPAFRDGVVTEVVTGKKQGDKGYGNYVIITDANGNKHRYSHLDVANVKVGTKISKGQAIGTMGNTGSTYSTKGGDGTHLDYRIHGQDGKYVNPYEYLSSY